VITPAERAADLVLAALGSDGLEGRSVVDLGSGTGRLAIGAALLGANPVTGVEIDADLVQVARAAAQALGAKVEFVAANVQSFAAAADLVVMNPPFGAQTAHADRPFWERAFALARRSVHAFALADSRTFIARRAVAARAQVLELEPVDWELTRTFPHHSRRRVVLPVDRWAIRTGSNR
jgi:putative methylase